MVYLINIYQQLQYCMQYPSLSQGFHQRITLKIVEDCRELISHFYKKI